MRRPFRPGLRPAPPRLTRRLWRPAPGLALSFRCGWSSCSDKSKLWENIRGSAVEQLRLLPRLVRQRRSTLVQVRRACGSYPKFDETRNGTAADAAGTAARGAGGRASSRAGREMGLARTLALPFLSQRGLDAGQGEPRFGIVGREFYQPGERLFDAGGLAQLIEPFGGE